MKTKLGGGLRFGALALAATIQLVSFGTAKADDVPEFTVISKATIDGLRDRTFEGQRIGDLLPERIEWQIREHNLTITLKSKTKPNLPMDPRLVSATKEFGGQAKVDPATFMIQGYKAGVPFPQIDGVDPLAPVKVIWNFLYGQPHGDQFQCPFIFTYVEASSGIERNQNWMFARFYARGRLTGASATDGDGTIFHKSLLFATFPQDIKGLGTFSIRYAGPQLDDIWAYVRTVRRVRRLSGGAWVDPIGGTDFLQDDNDTFNAHPSWYKSYKLVGKKNVLAPANSQGHIANPDKRASWVPEGASLQDQFPRMDLSASPYWNPKDVWEIRPVYVVESTPPDFHPYTKRVNWIDAENWRPYFGAAYDRKGEFWKWQIFASRAWQDVSGYIDPATGKATSYMFTGWAVTADFQRRHATFGNIPACTMNPTNLTSDSFALSQLEAAGR